MDQAHDEAFNGDCISCTSAVRARAQPLLAYAGLAKPHSLLPVKDVHLKRRIFELHKEDCAFSFFVNMSLLVERPRQENA